MHKELRGSWLPARGGTRLARAQPLRGGLPKNHFSIPELLQTACPPRPLSLTRPDSELSCPLGPALFLWGGRSGLRAGLHEAFDPCLILTHFPQSALWPADPVVSFHSRCPSHPTLLPASETRSPHTPTPTTEKIGELSLATGHQIHTLSPSPHLGPDPAATTRRGPASPLHLRSSVKRPAEAKKE